MSKVERQARILQLIEHRHLSTQSELAGALHDEGIDTVQATVSRDIAQLGLVKVRNPEGRLVYALPGAADLRRFDELTSALRNYLGETASSGTILVIRTPRGFAAALADAIDDAALSEVAGTIAGDNTVFVAARTGFAATDLDTLLRSHL